jgi:uncharacterized membrane protein YgdD (TMEM256/DUF423 family)
MTNESRLLVSLAGVFLLSATAAAAVASHVLTGLDARALDSFETAVQFQFFQALGLVAVVLVGERLGAGTLLRCAAWLLVAGVLLFCGSIYAATFGASRGVLALAPYGGVALMLAWLLFAAAVWRGRSA